MHFTRVRLSGFKSFVDPTELLIEPGLTGVVGPNGCGKSNVLEAIRWVMGENSPKSMRGSGMDDVIFAGTTNRPARNLAEVTLHIDNQSRRAPAPFNDEVIIEVTRRIERESGSAYRINGREVRARDVQLLFADLATGAHSPALVSQGRIGALISAKPADRRALLEEAAGISGLHSRRDEAERRLRGAETNLTRLNDVMQQIDVQIQNLRKQAKQATRYRALSGLVRQQEAILLYLQWKLAAEKLIVTESALREVEADVAAITGEAGKHSATQAELAAKLPELRHAEAERAAALHHLAVAHDGLLKEEQRIEEAQARLAALDAQIISDAGREDTLIADARAAVDRLRSEEAELISARAGEGEAQQAAQSAVETAVAAAGTREAELDALKNELAALGAERNRLRQVIAGAEGRLLRLTRERDMLDERLAGYASTPEMTAVTELTDAIKAAEDVLADRRAAIETARAALERGRDDERSARDRLQATETDLARLESERTTLQKLLAAARRDGTTPLVDRLTVDAGFEMALGAALGDDLEAPYEEAAPIAWRELPPYDAPTALPTGATPLLIHVRGAAGLARRLSQVGIVDSVDTGERLQSSLKPGQRLVTRDGALWRWDGLKAAADAPTAAAIRLSQKNRLLELEHEAAIARQKVEAARADAAATRNSLDAAAAAEREAVTAVRTTEGVLGDARRKLAEAERKAAEQAAREAATRESLRRLGVDIKETDDERQASQAALNALPETDSLNAKVEEMRRDVDALRQRLAEARARHDRIAGEVRHRADRLAAIARDIAAWEARLHGAERQLGDLAARRDQVAAEREALASRPQQIAIERARLTDEIEKAETARQQTSDTLAAAEGKLYEVEKILKEIHGRLLEVREKRARVEATLEQIVERRREAASRIMEEFDTPPADLPAAMEMPADLPELSAVEHKLDSLKRERERLGAVNLRADIELQEFEDQLGNLTREREDLETAIQKLRQAIMSLNREGRERLLAAFAEVNNHFGVLFRTLFGGGHAHLALTESDDPLEAGLEIMASPPGKNLQVLSLLSGGEQALTAMALIFAVFMTNPAPICVLNEVDAPLDDANVDRFCNLLDEMVRRTETRFLIVTHNAVTMSRMNRLFGVTMAERGISQLVSVDLERAERLRAVG